MADVTERLKLYLTPASTDKTFLSWRTEMSGDTDSNMVKLDEAIAVLQDAMAGKQEELTFDDTPAADSRNPVTSAGIKSYVDAAVAGKDIGVSTFNGRTGAVTPAAGDYTCEMVGADPAGSAAAVQSGLDTHVGDAVFQNISYQQFSKYGTATFISQNKSERRDVTDDLFSIVKTRIGPRPQNTGDTSLLAT